MEAPYYFFLLLWQKQLKERRVYFGSWFESTGRHDSVTVWKQRETNDSACLDFSHFPFHLPWGPCCWNDSARFFRVILLKPLPPWKYTHRHTQWCLLHDFKSSQDDTEDNNHIHCCWKYTKALVGIINAICKTRHPESARQEDGRYAGGFHRTLLKKK